MNNPLNKKQSTGDIIWAIIVVIGCLIFVTKANASDNTVARVIYSEASPICSAKERYLVASVISNRIDHAGFYNLQSGKAVVIYPKAFSAYRDTKNSNWHASRASNSLKTLHELNAWKHAVNLQRGINSRTLKAQHGVHFFVTKGFKVPSSYYSSKYWTLHKHCDTKHFTFYGIRARQ
jgi:hypothetical protein